MPTYDLVMIYRTLSRPEMKAALRRTADAIFDQGGFIRKIDNLGLKPTPYKLGAHGKRYKEGHYFILNLDAPILSLAEMRDNYKRDVDVVKSTFHSHSLVSLKDKVEEECTLHEDMKPPPYRKSVQEMLEKGRQKMKRTNKKKAFDFGPGLDSHIF